MAAVGSSIADLLQEHGADVKQVLERALKYVEEQNDADLSLAAEEYPVDDFTCLKFILSALRKKPKQVESAFDALIATLHFQKERRHDVVLKAKEMKEFQSLVPIFIGGFLNGCELIAVSRFGEADFHDIAKRFGNKMENITTFALVGAEQIRLILDKQSRSTGKLCKILSVCDLRGSTMRKASNMTVLKALGVVSKHNEVNTPQAISKIVMFHAFYVFRMTFAVCKPFMSKGALEKIAICGAGRSDDKNDISVCPFISKIVDGAACVPDGIGGSHNSSSLLPV